ncbi:MAG: MBL fold metallo-hydrolase [Candidatus Glassbacteria bacterium]|nr:MBL fold metallo-hydrolase [Candidatus Glassbacteria bacterium]
MDRRHFIALGGLGLGAGCARKERQAGPAAAEGVEARSYARVVQHSPAGYPVVHDRMTFVEQFKYEHWEAGRDWKDDCQLWSDFSYRWGQITLPIQRRPMRVLDGLYLLGPEDYHQCIYLWDTGKGLLLIDPSYERFRPMIETQIRQLGFHPGQVRWVLLTHMHGDHIESAGAYAERGSAVFIHRDDAGAVRGGKAMAAARIAKPVERPEVFGDGDRLDFGGVEMTVIQTPGHTPGSSCFALDWMTNRVLISGDVVLHFGRHAWMGADYCDWDQYLESLWKLYRYPGAENWEVLLPGHGTLDLDGARDSLYKVIQVVSYIIRLRRAGSEIDWADPYELFWRQKMGEKLDLEPLETAT